MFYLLPIICLLGQAISFPAAKPVLADTYHSSFNPGGAHTFHRKLVLQRSQYKEIQYPTSATSQYKYLGRYRVKADTLILTVQKMVSAPTRHGRHRSPRVERCTEDTSFYCRPAYYLIRQDSLIGLRYSRAGARYARSRYFFVAER